jgi:hypothetical protein
MIAYQVNVMCERAGMHACRAGLGQPSRGHSGTLFLHECPKNHMVGETLIIRSIFFFSSKINISAGKMDQVAMQNNFLFLYLNNL